MKRRSSTLLNPLEFWWIFLWREAPRPLYLPRYISNWNWMQIQHWYRYYENILRSVFLLQILRHYVQPVQLNLMVKLSVDIRLRVDQHHSFNGKTFSEKWKGFCSEKKCILDCLDYFKNYITWNFFTFFLFPFPNFFFFFSLIPTQKMHEHKFVNKYSDTKTNKLITAFVIPNGNFRTELRPFA